MKRLTSDTDVDLETVTFIATLSTLLVRLMKGVIANSMNHKVTKIQPRSTHLIMKGNQKMNDMSDDVDTCSIQC